MEEAATENLLGKLDDAKARTGCCTEHLAT